jgi:nitrous oxidase accessory protein NosD
MMSLYQVLFITIVNAGLMAGPPLALDAVSPQKTVVVAQDGTGDYAEIQRAIDNSTAGDTIFIKSGNYKEDVVVHSKNRLRLVGESRDSVIIQGLKRVGAFRIGKWPYGANDIEVRDLTVSENGGLAVGIFNGSRILFSNVHVRGMLYVQQATDVKIERSQLGDSETTGVSFADARGELVENEIRNNDYGVTIAGKSDVLAERNVITNNQYEGIVVQAGAKGTIVRNTILKSGQGIKVEDGAHAELVGNIIATAK